MPQSNRPHLLDAAVERINLVRLFHFAWLPVKSAYQRSYQNLCNGLGCSVATEPTAQISHFYNLPAEIEKQAGEHGKAATIQYYKKRALKMGMTIKIP